MTSAGAEVTRPGRLPDFLIVGAAKSGTTSLSQWLAARRDVFVHPNKELHFFSRDNKWNLGVDWYRNELAGGGEHLVGEATPTYLAHPEAPARIAEVAPDARCIAILRDPVDRAWSHYWYDRAIALNDSPPFEEIVRTVGTASEHPYLSHGRYVRQLQRYAHVLPRDQMLVLWFDTLRDDPVATWRTACTFLGLDPDPAPAAVGSVHNRHYRLRWPWVRKAMIRMRAWRRLPFGLAPRIDRLVRDEGGYEAMPAETQRRLREAYAEDNRALAEWLGSPLPAGWSA
jgi:hypothetical protein